jgi:uncharacterized protein
LITHLFRSLLPHDERFVQQLGRHAAHVADGAGAFLRLLRDGDPDACYAALCQAEEAADGVAREILQAIHRSFITPFDRSQILELATALDDTVDLMKETARRIRLYGVAFTPEMRVMAECAQRATALIRDAVPLLADIGRNLDGLNRMQDEVRIAESEADAVLARGLRALFATTIPTGDKLLVEKVYDLIELVVDRCEDVADVIEGIVVEQV